MSEVGRHSLNMQGRLMERAGRRGCPVGMCHRQSWSSVHTQELEGEVDTVGGPSEPVWEVARCRGSVCARSLEDTQPPMHRSVQGNHISTVLGRGRDFREEVSDLALEPTRGEQVTSPSLHVSLVQFVFKASSTSSPPSWLTSPAQRQRPSSHSSLLFTLFRCPPHCSPTQYLRLPPRPCLTSFSDTVVG